MIDAKIRSRAELNCDINEDKKGINCYNNETFSEIDKINIQKDAKDPS